MVIDRLKAVRYKTQVLGVRMTVRKVTFDDPAEAAAATERWNSSASVMLQLLERYETQVLGMPAVRKILFHDFILQRKAEIVRTF
jgi:hypothetical protein